MLGGLPPHVLEEVLVLLAPQRCFRRDDVLQGRP
jgi:hypothetical protein